MNGILPDPYSVLGVPRTATAAEIAHAYRVQVRANHPDTRPTGPGAAGSGADDQLRRLIAAYTLLHDPERRNTYNRTHPAKPEPPVGTPTTRAAARPDTRVKDTPPLRAGPVHWRPA